MKVYVAIDCNGSVIGVFYHLKKAKESLKSQYEGLKYITKINNTYVFKGIADEDCYIQKSEIIK